MRGLSAGHGGRAVENASFLDGRNGPAARAGATDLAGSVHDSRVGLTAAAQLLMSRPWGIQEARCQLSTAGSRARRTGVGQPLMHRSVFRRREAGVGELPSAGGSRGRHSGGSGLSDAAPRWQLCAPSRSSSNLRIRLVGDLRGLEPKRPLRRIPAPEVLQARMTASLRTPVSGPLHNWRRERLTALCRRDWHKSPRTQWRVVRTAESRAPSSV